jgi:GPH family glycoside/pentoside/hexuronide:cation symporter
MNETSPQPPSKALLRHIVGYSMGQGAMSLTFNGIAACSMLYYTQALGLPFAKAGAAFAMGSLWDAIIDPALGHLSDNTHTRWGRRLPYIFVGGLMMAASFYLVWAIPRFVITGGHLFLYAAAINIAYRTAYAVFTVPYSALGFEICTDYVQRSELQGIGFAINMLANLAGPALGWYLFFPDSKVRGGPEATSVASNFLHMGTAFTIATVGFTLIVVLATRRYMGDTRGVVTGTGNSPSAFYRDVRQILTDRYLRPILIFFSTGLTGTVFVGMLQMYLYVYFLHLTSLEKTIVHGGGMVMCGLGALLSKPLVRLFDKKRAVCIGAAISVCADLVAGLVYLGRIVKPLSACSLGGHAIPVGVVFYGGCDMINWLGVGIYIPVIMSMVADASEVDDLHSGVRKDGGYSAVFAFVNKLVQSVAGMVAGVCLTLVGFVPGSDMQGAGAIGGLVYLTFGLGAFFTFLMIPIALPYPVDREFMAKVKAALAKRRNQGLVPPNLV